MEYGKKGPHVPFDGFAPVIGGDHMNDEDKTKEQLIQELARLRQRIAVLEKSKAGSKQVEPKLADSEVRYRRLF
jgi:hypothetical protein